MRYPDDALYERPQQVLVMDACALTGIALCALAAGVMQAPQCQHVNTISGLKPLADRLKVSHKMAAAMRHSVIYRLGDNTVTFALGADRLHLESASLKLYSFISS